jgi:hypothetical protein
MASMLFDREGKTFCSKHCVEVLKIAGVRSTAKMRPAEITPSALFRALKNSSVFHAEADVVAGLRIGAL